MYIITCTQNPPPFAKRFTRNKLPIYTFLTSLTGRLVNAFPLYFLFPSQNSHESWRKSFRDFVNQCSSWWARGICREEAEKSLLTQATSRQTLSWLFQTKCSQAEMSQNSDQIRTWYGHEFYIYFWLLSDTFWLVLTFFSMTLNYPKIRTNCAEIMIWADFGILLLYTWLISILMAHSCENSKLCLCRKIQYLLEKFNLFIWLQSV